MNLLTYDALITLSLSELKTTDLPSHSVFLQMVAYSVTLNLAFMFS